MKKLNLLISKLSDNNSRSFYLAFLRVALCLWLLKELFFNWTSLELLYGNGSFVAFHTNNLFEVLNINVHLLREYYMVIVFFYVIFIVFYLFGIGKNFTALMVYLFVDFFQRFNHLTLNGGDNLLKFILLYLVFANTYEFFSTSKLSFKNKDSVRFSNLLTNLAALSIVLHLCLAYFIAGIAKAHADVWYNGIATYYIFSLDRFKGTPYNQYLVQNGWFVLITTYFTILFELYFPILIWIKKLRIPLIIAGIGLHLGIYVLMMIYGFQWIFMLTYGLFFTNQELFKMKNLVIDKVKSIFKRVKQLRGGVADAA